MHEMSLFKDILQKIESLSYEYKGQRLVKFTIRLGALSHISPAHFSEHFEEFSKGTAAEGATLVIIEDKDKQAPYAQGIILESIDVAS